MEGKDTDDDQMRQTTGGLGAALLHEQFPLAVIEWDARFRVRQWNGAAERIFGYTREEMLGSTAEELLSRESRPELAERWRQITVEGAGQRSSHRNITKNGRTVYCDWFHSVLFDERGTVTGILSLVQDVTERRESQLALRRQKNLYQALSETNHAITRAQGINELFVKVCEIAVHYGDLRLAWIGYVDPGSLWVEPLAWYGASEGYLEHIAVSADPACPEGQGPTGRAISEGRLFVIDDFLAGALTKPWHAAAEAAGLRSSAAFPLRRGGRPVAVLNVYADEVGYFTPDLVALLEEMTSDISFAIDNIDREAQRHRVEAERDRLADILEATPDFVGMADLEGRVMYRNAGARKILGLTAGDGPRPPQVGDSHPEWAARIIREEAFPTALREGFWQGESAILGADGHEVPVSQIIVAHRDASGAVTHLSTIARDISQLKHAQAQIQHLAYYDGLTGLANRQLLKDRLSKDINRARRNRVIGAVLHLDLDRLKTINDSLGHRAGDLLLQETAKRLVAGLRAEDTVARTSADEFVLVLAECGTHVDEAANGAQTVAEAVLASVARPYLVDGTEVHVSAGIGVALYPVDDDSVEAVLRRADTAKHRAKADGGNAIQFFEPQMQLAAQQRLRLERDLRDALQRQELALHFQPQVQLADGAIVGAEALLRWHHPERGMVPPNEFIPVAEETGLILVIGDWVMRDALAHIHRWTEAGLCGAGGSIAVNVSPRQFRQPDFVEQVASALESSAVPAGCLKIEITENVVLDDIADTIEKMGALKELGVGMAIDDFGTGYSSLAYLSQLPLDTLKIDKSFVDRVTSEPRDAALVETILAMARHLDLHAVAEGVETAEQTRFLREKGCLFGQGYYYSRPVTGEEFAALLAQGHLPVA